MRAFVDFTAVAAILLRDNVDTDAIIPSREITTVAKTGLAGGLFAGWRYLDAAKRTPDPSFALNEPKYRGAEILLAGENFGCGSSREHAVWALAEYGFKMVIAASFNPLFHRNCVRNGLLPAQVAPAGIAAMAAWVACDPQSHKLSVSLAERSITDSHSRTWRFEIAAAAREALLKGLDPIAQTLQMIDTIESFVAADRHARPWVYELTERGREVTAGG